jgi:hypothetical protein
MKNHGYYIIAFVILCLSTGIADSKVYIDDNNITIVNDKPFFPLGLYIASDPNTDSAIRELNEIADSPFNTIMNYKINTGGIEQIRRYLDAVNEHGLKLIYSLKDFYEGTKYFPGKVGHYKGEEEMTHGVITEFRRHPSILAWYLNDELPSKYIPRLTKRYKTVKSLDPDHPTWIVIYQINELKSYLDTTDIIGTDPYPISKKPIAMVGEWTKLTRKSAGTKKAVWMVPQAHNLGLYSKEKQDSPTFEQMRCMAYQCLVNGANGLIFYSYPDLKRDPSGFESRWNDVKRLGTEIKSLMPILLSTEPMPKVQLLSGAKNILFSAKYYDGKLYIMAVNTSDQPQNVDFVISEEVKNVKVLFEDRTITIEKYHLKDTFSPIAVHVYEVEHRD